jgi:DNA-binding IclR family transcriptional regulator
MKQANPELLRKVYDTIKEQPGNYATIAKRIGVPPQRMYTIMPAMEAAGYLLSEDPKYGTLAVFK